MIKKKQTEESSSISDSLQSGSLDNSQSKTLQIPSKKNIGFSAKEMLVVIEDEKPRKHSVVNANNITQSLCHSNGDDN